MSLFPQSESRRILCVLVLFVAIYLPLELVSSSRRSATVDEPVHLAAGYAALVHADYRFDPTHPPLLRMLAAVPLLGRVPAPPDFAPAPGVPLLTWLNVETYKVGSAFLSSAGGPDRLLLPARAVTTLLAALLGVLIFSWTYELMGLAPATVALALYTIEPNLSAHGTLVTTDLGITLFVFSTVYFLWRTHRAFTGWNVAGLAASFGLACASKYSAVALVPIAGVLLFLAARRGGALSPRRAWAMGGLLLVSGYLAVWAVYRFRYAPGPAGTGLIDTLASVPATDLPFYAPLAQWADHWHLLPNAYAQGLILCAATAQDIAGFLAGEVARDGWWYYFPVAFLAKTPVVLLVLFLGGALLRLHSPAGATIGIRTWILLPVGIYMAFAVSNSLNIGLRHILPIYPFVIVVAAAAWSRLRFSKRRFARYAAIAVVALAPLRPAFAWPYTLTYFNALVGGAANGEKLLADSNLDWGQGLKSLKTWMDENNVDRINLAYSGTVDPAAYGIKATLLPGSIGIFGVGAPELPGYVGISTTVQALLAISPEWELFYRGFEHQTPVATIANTIKIYRVDSWPDAPIDTAAVPTQEEAAAHLALANDLEFHLGWHRAAVRHYETFLRRNPDASAVRFNLAIALLSAREPLEARRILARLVLEAREPSRQCVAVALGLSRYGFEAESLGFAEYAVQLGPQDPVAHDAFGVALVAAHRYDEAEAQLKRAVELAPGAPHFRENLARLEQALAR